MKVNNMHDFCEEKHNQCCFRWPVFVIIHFVFTILSGEVSCNLSITVAKPKQMKLTEHSCCFDNEDDGNFVWRDARLCDALVSPYRTFEWTFYNGTQRDSPPSPLPTWNQQRGGTSKSSPQMWCLYSCLNEQPPLLHSQRLQREITFFGEPHCFFKWPYEYLH